jgi:hypothetical protein
LLGKAFSSDVLSNLLGTLGSGLLVGPIAALFAAIVPVAVPIVLTVLATAAAAYSLKKLMETILDPIVQKEMTKDAIKAQSEIEDVASGLKYTVKDKLGLATKEDEQNKQSRLGRSISRTQERLEKGEYDKDPRTKQVVQEQLYQNQQRLINELKTEFPNDPEKAAKKYNMLVGDKSKPLTAENFLTINPSVNQAKLRQQQQKEKSITPQFTPTEGQASQATIDRTEKSVMQKLSPESYETPVSLDNKQSAFGYTTPQEQQKGQSVLQQQAWELKNVPGAAAKLKSENNLHPDLAIPVSKKMSRQTSEKRPSSKQTKGMTRVSPEELAKEDPGLGSVSAKYESGGRGVETISDGKGDPGGKSYGKHQISSNAGTMAMWLDRSQYKDEFKGLTPGSEEFDKKYLEIAKRDPKGLEADQKSFITETHYMPARDAATEMGFKTDNRGVQDAIYSASVQHKGVKEILRRASKDPNFKNLSPEEQVSALYKSRSQYMSEQKQVPEQTRQNILTKRYPAEEKDALALAKQSSKPEMQLANKQTPTEPLETPVAMSQTSNSLPEQNMFTPVPSTSGSTTQLAGLAQTNSNLSTASSGGTTINNISSGGTSGRTSNAPVGGQASGVVPTRQMESTLYALQQKSLKGSVT